MGTPHDDVETITVSNIAAVSGEALRSVQHWAENGVLHPEPESKRKGKGVHRRFMPIEAEYARLAGRLMTLGCPLVEIRAVVDRLRQLDPSLLTEPLEELRDKALNTGNLMRFDLWSRYIDIIASAEVWAGAYTDKMILVLVYSGDGGLTVRIFHPDTLRSLGQGSWDRVQGWLKFAIGGVVGYKIIELNYREIEALWTRYLEPAFLDNLQVVATKIYKDVAEILHRSLAAEAEAQGNDISSDPYIQEIRRRLPGGRILGLGEDD